MVGVVLTFSAGATAFIKLGRAQSVTCRHTLRQPPELLDHQGLDVVPIGAEAVPGQTSSIPPSGSRPSCRTTSRTDCLITLRHFNRT